MISSSINLLACNKNASDPYFNTEESIMIPKLISIDKNSTFETISKNVAPHSL